MQADLLSASCQQSWHLPLADPPQTRVMGGHGGGEEYTLIGHVQGLSVCRLMKPWIVWPVGGQCALLNPL